MKPSPKMYLVYIDESYDSSHFVYAALLVPAFEWNMVFQSVREWRQRLFHQHAIPLDYELHATDFVAGRGEPNENRNKLFRGQQFAEVFDLVESLNGVEVYGGITSDKKAHLELFETTLTHIQKTLEEKNAYAVLVCDEGNETALTSLVRTMQKVGPVADRIIEDPLFKTSKSSYFLQLADFVAFGLLRNKQPAASTVEVVKTAADRIKKQVSYYPALGSEPPARQSIAKKTQNGSK
jgi:hypothetical protein